MAITPQAIKDQEFRVKLRGYDTIEVKAYLELIADEFFEMFEQAKQQTDYIDGLIEEKEELIDLRLRIEGDMTRPWSILKRQMQEILSFSKR